MSLDMPQRVTLYGEDIKVNTQQIEALLEDQALPTDPVNSIKTLTGADTEYAIFLGIADRAFSLKSRSGLAFRLAFITGKVATPTDPYILVPENTVYTTPVRINSSSAPGVIIYLASSNAGEIIEVIIWS